MLSKTGSVGWTFLSLFFFSIHREYGKTEAKSSQNLNILKSITKNLNHLDHIK